MSKTEDKTRQKLVNSMRETKSRPAAAKKRVPVKRTATEAEPGSKRSQPVASKSALKGADKSRLVADVYQSAGRVWPD